MSTKKEQRAAAREKREQAQAQRVIKGIFLCLILLAVVFIVVFSFAM
jgi:hypothetical protein